MKPLNQKEIRKSRWRLVWRFLPLVLVIVTLALVYRKINEKHYEELEHKLAIYRDAFYGQYSNDKILDDAIIRIDSMRNESYQSQTGVEYRFLQKLISDKIGEIDDTLGNRQFYGLFIQDLRMITSVKDSLRTLEGELEHQRDELNVCIKNYRKSPTD